jgi:DNA-binding transcriptional LysR family regulator
MYLDLNLLTALDALLDEGSVGGAAARLHLSQPAMSRTLARIRQATGDPILVRAGRGMEPSPRARALRDQVADVVRRGRALLSPAGALDPATLTRTFTIRCHDALLPSVGAALLGELRRRAPQVTIRFLAETSADAEELRQRVDLDLGSPRAGATGFTSETVGQDRAAVALRRDHPSARRRLTVARWAQAQHVLVSRRGRLRDPLDEELERRGLQRQVVAAAPTSAAALALVQSCHLVATVAARACGPLARSLGLVLRPLPLPAGPLIIAQSWPQHLDDDRAHEWLRGLLRSIVAETFAAR